MRKFVMSVALGMFLMGGVAASAATFATGGIKYHVLTDSTCEVAPQASPAYTGEITIPATVTNEADGKTYTVVALYDKAFFGTTVTKVTLPSTVEEIKRDCFNTSKLKEIVLPEGLKILRTQAFAGCALEEINLPNTLTTIESSMFFGSPLKGITIPASVVGLGGSLFGNCNDLEYVRVDPANKNFCAKDNVLYNKDCTMVYGYPGKCNVNVVFEPTVKSMLAHCGYGNKFLESITFNEGLKTVAIGAAAYGAQKLTKINFSSTVEEIQTQAFMQCPSLKEVEFPASVKSISSDAFNSDNAIVKIICHAVTPPVLGNAAFATKVYSAAEVIVPEEAYEAYTKDAQWSKFRKIIAKKEGEAPDYSATIQAMVTAKKLPLTNPTKLAFSVLNEGKKDISSLSGKFTVGEYTTPELTFDGLTLKSGSLNPVELPVDFSAASLQAGTRYSMSVELTKVNGQANASESPKFDFKVEFVNVLDTTGAAQATYCQNLDTPVNHLGGKVSHIDAAIHFKDANLVGAKVVGAKVVSIPTSGIKNVKIWNSTKLATTPDGDMMDATPIGDDEFTDVAVAFTNGVTLTADGAYFGVSMDIPDGQGYPIGVFEPYDQQGNIYVSADYKEFDPSYSEYGSLGIVLLIQTGDKPTGLTIASPATLCAGVKDQPFEIAYNVQNYTKEPVSELEYTYTIGSETKSGKIELETPLSPYMTQINTVTVPYEAVSTPGILDATINFTKVNGGDNKLAEDYASNISIGEFQTYHRPIMEEYTGTGCGYCPRGTVGMNELADRYPDFISAAYHNYPGAQDPMRLKTSMPVKITGAPGCMLDRNGATIDPYFGSESESQFGIEKDYLKQAAVLAPCDIALKTQWVAEGDNQKAGIKVEPTVTFSYVEKDQKYGMGYLLTIDSLSHPLEANWKQLNYFEIDAYKGEDSILARIYAGGGLDHYLYNHVVFDMTAAKIANPVDAAAIKVGQPYNYTKSFTLSDNSLVETDWLPKSDLSKVNVIAFVIDGKGVIRNAVKVRAGEEVLGVNPIIAAEELDGPVSYYDLMGRRVQNPQHGIYVRVQGNKASKVAL